MHPPAVVIPTTLDDALSTLAERPELRPVHGGTDAMVGINAGTSTADGWLSLRRVESLDRIDQHDGQLLIGAGVRFETIEHSLTELVPSLAAAARTVGSPQIRRAGTIGGNLATASPAADSVPPLLCHDAEVGLTSTLGTRWVPLDAFAIGPKQTVRRPDELIAAVRLTSIGGAQSFAKVGTRNAMVISICSLAARLDPSTGLARVAIGSAAPTVLRVRSAEDALLDPTGADAFAAEVRAAARPIDDARSTARYRTTALGVLARRAHAALWRSLTREDMP